MEGHPTSLAEVLHPPGYVGPDTGTDTRTRHPVLAGTVPGGQTNGRKNVIVL